MARGPVARLASLDAQHGALGQSNYYGNNGTASQIYGSSTTLFPSSESNNVTLGVFNVTLDSTSPMPTAAVPSPNYRAVTSKTTISSITDGTSNTALFSEVRISQLPFPVPASWRTTPTRST